ncbi:hypothetical protein BBJ29_008885 [Phytophthora kernoviae]|uniref:Uncharacterized protein n=1 Tax=Phytophthora kernoviae TaxID=325452 RepID=A0A3F2REJ3_9STRA|nr:hypothetical protein BBP00_00008740 [Phytophthora kernoviae]RLN57733.1 hypothetical protein BBJ29_008885 [Phytophthora kernoviae]
MLLLLSMTADKAASLTAGKEPEGYTSPPRRKELCRVNQANNKKRERAPITFGGLRLSASLTPDQATALAMAIDAQNRAARSVCGNNYQKARHPLPMQAINSIPDVNTNVWSGQQCLVDQAALQKRKREEESTQIAEIEVLKQQIKKLKIYKAAISTHKHHLGLFQSVSNFYYALGLEGSQQQLPDVKNYQQMYGCSPSLQLLLDLQREEFDSIASLQLHWLWYRTQFRFFQFSMTSCQRLEVGEHVVIKVTGKLRLDIYCGTNQQTGMRLGYGEIVCPVLQQFEFDAGKQTATRITSEVDLIGGVAASKDQNGPARILRVLHCLSEGFCLSNRS